MQTQKNKSIILSLALAAALIIGAQARAQSTNQDASTSRSSAVPELQPATDNELKPHIGLQVGFAEPGDNHDGAAQYGIEFGYQPYIPFSAALEVNSFLTDRDNQDNLRRTTAIVKGSFNFGGSTPIIRHSYLGTGIGAVMDAEGEDETNLGVKFLAGFDIPINRSGLTTRKTFTLGANASYLSVIDAQDTFALAGQLKYWF